MEAFVAAYILAHGWYEPSCCSDKDCRPAHKGEIVNTGTSYRIGTVDIPYNDPRVRMSQDGQFHVCKPPHTHIRCIYVPAGV